MARASWLLLFFLAWSTSAQASTLTETLQEVNRLATGPELDLPGVAGSGAVAPEFERRGTPLSRITPALIEVGVLALGLFLLGFWVSRRPEEGMTDHSLLWFLLTGLGFTLVSGAVCARIHMLFPMGGVLVTFFASPLVLVCVQSLGGYFGFEPKGYMPSACVVAALGMLWSMSLCSSEMWQVGVMVRNVDVRELPQAQGGAFMLRGALLQREFTAVMERESSVKNSRGKVTGRTSHTQLVAPLVFDGWTPAQPVPAWLVCQYDQAEEECGWGGTIENAVVPEGMGTVDAVDAIVEAERSMRLRSVPGARLLEWAADIRARVFEAVLFGLLLPLTFLGAFVVLAVYGQRWDEVPSATRK